MPSPIAHPAAAIPFRKIGLVFSALVAGIMFFILVGCGLVTPIPTGTPEWQPLPTFRYDDFPSESSSLKHYVPSTALNFHLEFDYPGSWWLTEHVDEVAIPSVSLGDRRFMTLATPSPSDFHPTPNDFGNIDIWIMPKEPGQTPGTELQSHKTSYSQTSWMTVLRDYKIVIDGHDAAVLEYEFNDQENYTSPMFARRIFFLVNDQIYEIIFEVAQKDRGGEFEEGYEQFFESLNIID